MSLDYLMDGACCTAVFIKASARCVAEALGQAHAMIDEGKACVVERPEHVRGYVFQAKGQAWSLVEWSRNYGRSEGYDSDPLLDQAEAVLAGQVPAVPFAYAAPVTIAHAVSEKLGVRSIALWGSDQGPGIGGAAFFNAGTLEKAYSAADLSHIEIIRRVRMCRGNEVAFESLEKVRAYESGSTFQFTPAMGGHSIEGDIASVVDAEVERQGADMEQALEPVSNLVWHFESLAPGTAHDNAEGYFLIPSE